MRAALALFACVLSMVAGAQTKRALAPGDALETIRPLADESYRSVFVAPDHSRYAVLLVRGDAAGNGVWLKIITGGLDSLSAASRFVVVANLFTTGLGSGAGVIGPEGDVADTVKTIRWLDNERLSFVWSDSKQIGQAITVNLRTHELRSLTRHPTRVRTYDLAPDGTVLYAAEAQHSKQQSMRLIKRGFTVHPDTDAMGLLAGDVDGYSGLDRFWNSEWFLERPDRPGPRKLVIGGDVDLSFMPFVTIAPDGRFAIVGTTPRDIPPEWDRYGGEARELIQQARHDRKASMGRLISQLHVVDLRSGDSRPLWNAVARTAISRQGVAWLGDGRSVRLSPTYLPADQNDERGLAGEAAAVIDVTTGRYRVLAAAAASEKVASIEKPMPIQLQFREDLNSPPRLYALDSGANREAMVLDLNPDLTTKFTLGRVTSMRGSLPSGKEWSGLLISPESSSSQRHPLVIQSQYGAINERSFTLYGNSGVAGLGPAMIAPYACRSLVGRGVAVFQLNVLAKDKFGTPAEADLRKSAFETVADRLAASGVADRARVGLAGFSRNGYYVEYTLTQSQADFAAALASDNWDPSYLQTALTGWEMGTEAHGTPPFGDGLNVWLKKAPGFNAEKIRAPLRIDVQSNGLKGVLFAWEIFSRLRHLGRPVELNVVPDIERGIHNTQNPAQIIAMQQGAVDWFVFWLTGYRDPDPEKWQQYVRWQGMRSPLPCAHKPCH